MAEHKEIQQAWSDFIAFFHKHKNVLQELSPNQEHPTKPGNVMLPGTSIPVGGIPPSLPPDVTYETDTPDDNGNVAIKKLPAAWAGWRFQIKEVTDGLTGDQQGHALANLTHANGQYTVGNMQFIGVCYESIPQGAGQPFKLDTDAPIAKTQSWPGLVHTFDGVGYDLATVNGVGAWATQLGKPPGPN